MFQCSTDECEVYVHTEKHRLKICGQPSTTIHQIQSQMPLHNSNHYTSCQRLIIMQCVITRRLWNIQQMKS